MSASPARVSASRKRGGTVLGARRTVPPGGTATVGGVRPGHDGRSPQMEDARPADGDAALLAGPTNEPVHGSTAIDSPHNLLLGLQPVQIHDAEALDAPTRTAEVLAAEALAAPTRTNHTHVAGVLAASCRTHACRVGTAT